MVDRTFSRKFIPSKVCNLRTTLNIVREKNPRNKRGSTNTEVPGHTNSPNLGSERCV